MNWLVLMGSNRGLAFCVGKEGLSIGHLPGGAQKFALEADCALFVAFTASYVREGGAKDAQQNS